MNENNFKLLLCLLLSISIFLAVIQLMKINRKNEQYCTDISGGYSSPCQSNCSFGCQTDV